MVVNFKNEIYFFTYFLPNFPKPNQILNKIIKKYSMFTTAILATLWQNIFYCIHKNIVQ